MSNLTAWLVMLFLVVLALAATFLPVLWRFQEWLRLWILPNAVPAALHRQLTVLLLKASVASKEVHSPHPSFDIERFHRFRRNEEVCAGYFYYHLIATFACVLSWMLIGACLALFFVVPTQASQGVNSVGSDAAEAIQLNAISVPAVVVFDRERKPCAAITPGNGPSLVYVKPDGTALVVMPLDIFGACGYASALVSAICWVFASFLKDRA